LSRHRIIQCSRSKAVALIAAGAFTVATAATAAAATWPAAPQAPAATHAHEADASALLTVSGQAVQLQSFDQSTANQAGQAYQVRDQAAALITARTQTIRTKTARKRTARKRTAREQLSGSPQQIAQAMLASFGWSSSQFSCLDPLWAHESGWSVTAYNAGSGAYGIPQALPGSRMASAGPDWQTSAATQIRWGLEYIKGDYGSPCGAWDHEQATGWY
jgi:hypothetical protein